MINDTVYGHLTAEKITDILKKIEKKEGKKDE